MGLSDTEGFAPQWLSLREDADAEARATEPPALLGGHGALVADLGCGTGAMGRWLVPRLPGPGRWLLIDRDPALLARAERGVAAPARTLRADLAALDPSDLDGVTLVTASALLDLLTGEQAVHLARTVVRLGCPALFALTVSGRVEFSPTDPWDEAFAAAFDAHQRRGGRLGPDAAPLMAGVLRGSGRRVRCFPSPWRLGPRHPGLTEAWLRGWVGAAVEQDPALPGRAYLERRSRAHAEGRLRAIVHHTDLLALPPRAAERGGDSAGPRPARG
ncbi:class I SAM-dependent methyltransferase [Nocardiopsis xinjiangensis]|uniref:class I SAM-dependent methyltransferase n=1 Tax=Nocardiopsis xinjiangensis TaxID=124285 RepID=UPI000368EE88